MSKRVIRAAVIEEVGKTVAFRLQEPGNIINTLTRLVPSQSSIISAGSTPVEPKMLPMLTIFYEADPDADLRHREFILIPPGAAVDSPNELTYRGTFMLPQGNIVFLYEELLPPEEPIKTELQDGG